MSHIRTDMSDLMKPRYEVTGDYPKSEYPKGMIIDLAQHPRYVSGNVMGSLFCSDEFFNGYPHLFRKLAWHEKRDIKDMPQYVKLITNMGQVHYYHYPDKDYLDAKFIKFKHGSITLKDFTPATEQEYTDFVNSKNQPK